MKKYILFDNDGVLVDTEPLYFQASQKALSEFFNINISLKDYMYIMVNGLGVWELIPNVKYISEQKISEARNKRNEYYQELIKSSNITIPHVKEVLEILSQKYKMAIVTSARREDFEIKHKNTGIPEMMEFILCEGEYPRSKPYPDPYIKALQLFNANEQDAIVIEDSERGLQAAYDANIECITVYNEFTKTQDFSKSTIQIENIKELLRIL